MCVPVCVLVCVECVRVDVCVTVCVVIFGGVCGAEPAGHTAAGGLWHA